MSKILINNAKATVKLAPAAGAKAKKKTAPALSFFQVADLDRAAVDSVTGQRIAVLSPAVCQKHLQLDDGELSGDIVRFRWSAKPNSNAKKHEASVQAVKKVFSGKTNGTFDVPLSALEGRISEAFTAQTDNENRSAAVSQFRIEPPKEWLSSTFATRKAVADERCLPAPTEVSVEGFFNRERWATSEILEKVERYGFAVINDEVSREIPKPERVERVEKIISGSFGVMRNSHYGMFSAWTSSEDAEGAVAADVESSHKDGAYQSCHLDLHTDATYFNEAPKVQVFGCAHRGASTIGGMSTMADGFAIAKKLKRADPKAYRVLSESPVVGKYFREGLFHKAARPVLRHDAKTGTLRQVSFNNADRASFAEAAMLQKKHSAAAIAESFARFDDLLKQPDNFVRFMLQPGNVLVFDNHRVLHGREGFSGPRTMCGAYVAMDDYNSTARQVGIEPRPTL